MEFELEWWHSLKRPRRIKGVFLFPSFDSLGFKSEVPLYLKSGKRVNTILRFLAVDLAITLMQSANPNLLKQGRITD
jgi:hypothetical protein